MGGASGCEPQPVCPAPALHPSPVRGEECVAWWPWQRLRFLCCCRHLSCWPLGLAQDLLLTLGHCLHISLAQWGGPPEGSWQQQRHCSHRMSCCPCLWSHRADEGHMGWAGWGHAYVECAQAGAAEGGRRPKAAAGNRAACSDGAHGQWPRQLQAAGQHVVMEHMVSGLRCCRQQGTCSDGACGQQLCSLGAKQRQVT
jgi:hypothetical protein